MNFVDLATEIADELQGTCMYTIAGLLEDRGYAEQEMPMEFFETIDDIVFLCDWCGWWNEIVDEVDGDQVCRQCVQE